MTTARLMYCGIGSGQERESGLSVGFLRALSLVVSLYGPNVVEQFHTPESVLARLLLQVRRVEITHGDILGEAAVILIRFRMHGEKSHVVRFHVVVFHQAVADRRRGGTEGSLGADLNRHNDEPWQGVNDQLDVIKVRRGGRAQLSVFELLFGQADGIGEADRQLVMTGAAGVHAAGLFFDDAPEPLGNLRIGAGQVAHHRDAWHRGAKLVVLNRPGADLLHGCRAVAYRLQEWMLDADFGKRLNVLFELVHEFLACHISFLLLLVSRWSDGVLLGPLLHHSKTPTLQFYLFSSSRLT